MVRCSMGIGYVTLSLCVLCWLTAMTTTTTHAWTTTTTPPTRATTSSSQRRTTLFQLHYSLVTNNNEEPSQPPPSQPPQEESFFFIRKSMMGDMGRASTILADGFYRGKTNFIVYQLERLETYLSLESGFPKPEARHELFVACHCQTGQVLGMAEVDARRIEDKNEDRGTAIRGQNGPYMCNVAVDHRFQRKGIASALVRECERQTQDWSTGHRSTTATDFFSNSLHLKVRESNTAAVAMYVQMGYRSFRQETEKKTGDTVLVMRKEL